MQKKVRIRLAYLIQMKTHLDAMERSDDPKPETTDAERSKRLRTSTISKSQSQMYAVYQSNVKRN